MPRVSKVRPTRRTKVPLRCGSGVRSLGKLVCTSLAKSIMGYLPTWIMPRMTEATRLWSACTTMRTTPTLSS